MARSLQEQLLNAGLVSPKQVKQASAANSRKDRQQRHQKTRTKDQTRLDIERRAAEKAERDLLLNRERELENQRRATDAQIKQLVDENQIAEDGDGEAFYFDHHGFVKKVYVSEAVRRQLINGQFAIVISETRYRLVPSAIALKIKARDEAALVLLQDPARSAQDNEIDPAYAAYKIPDDLIW